MGILVAVLAVVALLVVLALVRIRVAARAARIRAAGMVEGARVVRTEDVRSLGRERKDGGDRFRGNLTLVLTDHEILLAGWVPANDLRIPRKAVTQVETTKDHGGIKVVREAVRIRYKAGGGAKDAIAFQSREPEAWLDAFASR